MSSAGWYPDPGGQPGLYRYWTGTAWTAAVTANPQATPPPTAPLGQPQSGGGSSYEYPTRKRGGAGWWVAGLAAVLAVALIGWFLVQGFARNTGGTTNPGNAPGGVPTPNICPPGSSTTAPVPANPSSGWVSGGRLSYPMLGEPWSAPSYDNRVPFGSLAMMQEVVDQPNFDGEGNNWVASILVSDLYVGDGFASTKVGAETVLKCVLGTYYADTVVKRSDISSKAHPVGGKDGWLIETQLSFDIPNLVAKGERVLLLVVQTGQDEYGLFYASVPDTLQQLVPDARKALDGLRVD